MIRAYVLIQITAPNPLEVLEALRQIPEVKQAHIVLGPIDCIVFVECPDHEALQETLVQIRWVKGVASTDTRFVYA